MAMRTQQMGNPFHTQASVTMPAPENTLKAGGGDLLTISLDGTTTRPR
jgi:hypothetical protein